MTARSSLFSLLLVLGCGGGDASHDADVPDPDDPGPGALDGSHDPSKAHDPGPYPTVTILKPERGSFVSGCGSDHSVNFSVASSAPLDEVLLQKQVLSSSTGIFEESFTTSSGLNLIRAEATTIGGAVGRDHRSVLCGNWIPASRAIEHAADLYLGKQAIATLGSLTAKAFDTADLSSLFATLNPLYESELVTVTALSLDRGKGTVASLLPTKNNLLVHFEVLDLEAVVNILLNGSSGSPWVVTIHADTIVVDGELHVAHVPGGLLSADLTALAFDFVGLQVDVSGVTGDLLAVFPDYKETLVSLLEDWLSGWLVTFVPDAAQKALGTIGEPIPFDVLGKTFSIALRPAGIDISPKGIHLGLDLAVEGLAPVPDMDSPGVLGTPGQEAWPDVTGVRLSLKDDLINTVFHEAWRAGLTRLTIDQKMLDGVKAEVDLVAGFLGGVLDLLPVTISPETPISIEINATYPPVADLDVPVSGGIRLGIGDLMLGIRSQVPSQDLLLLSLAVTLRIEGEVKPTPSNAVDVVMHTFDVVLDVVNDDGTFSQVEAYLEDTTGELLKALGPTVSELLGSIPLPSFGGFALTNLHAGTETADGGIVVISGDLMELNQ